jgi:CheY-like chemotaxis protein
MQVAIRRVLTTAGYGVNTAKDGEEGLELARQTRPDLLLLDMMLPGASGLEVLRALKKDPATSDIPVIALAALSPQEGKKLSDEGAAAYLEKSDKLLANDSAVLLETVGRVLGKP